MPKLNKAMLNVTAKAEVLNCFQSPDFKVGVKAEADGVEILIHGAIGDSWTATDSTSITNILKEHRGKPVHVDINSPGGLAFDGISIYNALVQHDAPVDVSITGLAASAATIIAMAGDTIRIAANATFMIHRAWGVSIGNHKVMDDVSEMLQVLDTQIAATYAARTGRKPETMLKLMDGSVDGTTFTGEQAVKEGFADAVIPLKKKSKEEPDNKTPAVDTKAMAEQFRAYAATQLKAEVDRRVRAVHGDGLQLDCLVSNLTTTVTENLTK